MWIWDLGLKTGFDDRTRRIGCQERRKSVEFIDNWCSGCRMIIGWVSYQIWDLGRWNLGFSCGMSMFKRFCQEAVMWGFGKRFLGMVETWIFL